MPLLVSPAGRSSTQAPFPCVWGVRQEASCSPRGLASSRKGFPAAHCRGPRPGLRRGDGGRWRDAQGAEGSAQGVVLLVRGVMGLSPQGAGKGGCLTGHFPQLSRKPDEVLKETENKREAALLLVPASCPGPGPGSGVVPSQPPPSTPGASLHIPPPTPPTWSSLSWRARPLRRQIVQGSSSSGGPRQPAAPCCTVPAGAPWAPASTRPAQAQQQGPGPGEGCLILRSAAPASAAPPRPSQSLALFVPPHPSSPFRPVQASASHLTPHEPLAPVLQPVLLVAVPAAPSSACSYPLGLRLHGAVDNPAQDFQLRVQLDAGQAFPLPLGRGHRARRGKG